MNYKFLKELSPLEKAAFQTVYKATIYIDNEELHHILFQFNEGRVGLDTALIDRFVELFNEYGYALAEYNKHLNKDKIGFR